MRTLVCLALTSAVVVAGCGTDVASDLAPEASATAVVTSDAPVDESEGEPRFAGALFGEDVCIALLPALDGNLDGLEVYATDEVLAVLHNDSGQPLSDAAETYAGDDPAVCTIVVGDWWVDLELLGDGHVGQRAIAFTEHSSYGDADAEHEARTMAVAAWLEDPAACDGYGQTSAGDPDENHLAFGLDGLMVVAITCDAFAYQSLFELRGWDGEATFALDVEQWSPAGVGFSPLLLGYPGVGEDGLLVNLEKARGVGDCGLWQTWRPDGAARLVLVEARARDCDDGAEYVEPDQWPLVHPA